MFEEDEDLLGGSPDYGRPSATFSEDSVASSYTSQQDIEFQGLQKNLDLLQSSKSIADSARIAADKFSADKEQWGKDTFGQFYAREFQGEDYSKLSADEMKANLDSRFDMLGLPVDPQYTKTAEEWRRRTENQAAHEAHATATGVEYGRLSSLKSQLSPTYLSAYNNWKASSGGRKLNGKNSVYMDPEKANEVLDFLDMADPNTFQIEDALKPGGLEGIDPRYEFKGKDEFAKAKNQKQVERRKALMRGDMEAAWKEVSRAERFRAAGYQTPPSWMNEVGGVNRMVSGDGERREVLVGAAQAAELDYFTDDEGNKRSIQEYIKTSPYTDEERTAIMLMNQLGTAKTKYDDLQIKFWSNFDKLKNERDEDDVWGQMQLEKEKRDSLIKQLSAMGYGQEMINRTESLRDTDMLSGAWRAGQIQGDISDFSSALFLGNMGSFETEEGKKNWNALSELAEQQDMLQQYLADNDMSPMAKMSRLSAEQKDSWLAAAGRWFGIGDGSDPLDGVRALGEITANQLRGFMWEYAANLPETVGLGALTYGAAGSLTGPGAGAFAATGAAHGARINWGITSAAMEYTATILEAMKEEGVDVHNPKAFSAAWMNDEIKNKVRAKAAKKTGVVAIFDTASAFMGGSAAALFKSPSVVTKIPGSVGVGKQTLKGLSKGETDRLTELRKLKRKGKVQRDSQLEQEMMKLEGKRTGGIENEFSKALAKSDATVNRTTWKHRGKNIALEAGVQAGLGGGGELLSQALANEPGQPIDKQAVFAEMAGEIGAGPALLGYGNELTKKPNFKNYKNAVIEAEEELAPGQEGDGPYALRGGGVRRSKNMQGWQFDQVRYDDFTDAVKDIARQTGMPMQIANEKGEMQENPEIIFQNELVSGIQNLLKPKGLTLEFVVSDRTPDSVNSHGMMQTQPENNAVVIYINKEQLAKDGENLTGVLLHEIGHAYGEGILGRNRLMRYYNDLTPEQKKQSYAHYKFKDQIDFVDANNLPDPIMQEKFDKEWDKVKDNKETEYTRAHEWFTFEFARVLAGSQRDYGTVPTKSETEDGPDIPGPQQPTERVQVENIAGQPEMAVQGLPAGEAANIRLFIDSYIHPLMSKWIGSGVREERPNRPIGDDVTGLPKPGADSGRRAEVKPNNVVLDAEILTKMQFGVSPANKLVYMGKENKAGPWELGMDYGDATALGDMRNKLLSQEQYIKDISTVLGEGMGKRMLKERVDETSKLEATGFLGQSTADYGAEPLGYKINEADPDDLGLIDADDIDTFMQQGLQREQELRMTSPTDRATMDKATRDIKRARILKQIDEGTRKKKLKDLKKDPKGPKPVGDYTFATRARAQLSQAIAQAEKKKPAGKVKFQGKVYSLAEAIQLREDYDSQVTGFEQAADARLDQEEAEMNVPNKKDPKTGVFRPAMERNRRGELVPDKPKEVDYSDQAKMYDIASIEGANKLLEERGTSLEKVNKEMDKIIEMDDKKLLDMLKKDLDDLYVDKGGRALTEELFGKIARKTGMDAVADAQLRSARGALSDNERIETDLASILEAYETFAYEDGAKKVELIQNKIESIQGEIALEEKTIKDMESDTAVSAKDSKDIAKTINALKTSLKDFKSKGAQTGLADKEELRRFLLDTITAPDAEAVAKELSGFLSGPVVGPNNKEVKAYAQKLDMLTKDVASMGQTAENSNVVSAMKEAVPGVVEGIQSITGIKTPGQKQKISGTRASIDAKKKKVEKLENVKSSIAVVSETVDVRNVPAVIKFTPDDAKTKGINFGDMRLVTYDKKAGKKKVTDQKITLEDLAKFDKLEVGYYKDGKDQVFTINGKQELAKLSENFDWAMDEVQRRDFERETGQNYNVYRSNIYAALAAMREGDTKITRFGPKKTAYFKTDEGVTKSAVMMERILRLPGVYQRLRKKAEKKSDQALSDFEKEYGTFGLLQDYDTYSEKVRRSNEKTLRAAPDFLTLQSKKKTLLRALGLSKPPRPDANIATVLNQAAVKRLRKNGNFADIFKEIDAFVGKGKLKKKITFRELQNALGVGDIRLKEIRQELKLEKPQDLLSEDRLAVNLTNSRLAELLGSSDTEMIGGSRFNRQDQAALDFALYIEREILTDIQTRIDALDSGRVAPNRFEKDATYKTGDLFYFGGRMWKAFRNIDPVGSFAAFDITQYANPASYQAEVVGGKIRRVNTPEKVEEGTVPITEEQREQFTQELKSLRKRLDSLNKIYEWEFHRSDLNAAQPKYKNQAGFIESLDIDFSDGMIPAEITTHEYRHLLMRIHEEIALSGKNKAFQDSLSGGRTTGSMFDHYNTANIDIKKDFRKAKLDSVAQLMPLTDQSAIAQLLDDLISITKKQKLDENFNEYQPEGLDFGIDLAKEWMEMLANGDLRLPAERRGLLWKGKWVDNMATIESSPAMKAAYEEQQKAYRNMASKLKLPLSLDLQSTKGDPVVRALGLSYDDNRNIHDDVRNHIQREIANESLKRDKNGRIAIRITPKVLKKLPKNTKLDFDGKKELTVYWNPTIASPHTAYIQEAVTGDALVAELRDSIRRRYKTLIVKGQQVVLNGYKFTAKNDIDIDSTEGQSIAQTLGDPLQQSWVPVEAHKDNLNRIFNDSASFTKSKKRVTNPAEKVGLNHGEMSNQVARKQAEIKSLKLEIEEYKDDVTEEGQPNVERKKQVAKLENRVGSLELEIETLNKFRKGELTNPKDWWFSWVQGEERYETKVKKEGDDFIVQVLEPGGFQKKDKGKELYRNLSEDENNILLSLFAYQNSLKPDENVGQTIGGEVRDDVARMQAIQNLSSFIMTARQLAQKIFDAGGVDRMLMLEGSHSRYYAEAEGGFPLIEWITHIPDLMLDKLEQSGLLQNRETQLQNLLDIYEKIKVKNASTRREVAFLESRLEKIKSDREAGVNYSTKVLLNYVANFRMEKAKKMAPIKAEKGGLSSADLTEMGKLINNKQQQDFYVATLDQKFRQGEVIKVGQIQAVKGEDGKVIEKGFPAYARVHIDDNMKDENGNPKKMSASDLLDGEDAPTNVGTLKKRWPTFGSKEASKKENEEAETTEATYAYPYRLELVYNEAQIESTFQNAEVDAFKTFKEGDKSKAQTIKKLSAELHTLGEDPQRILDLRKASKFAKDLFYLENEGTFFNELMSDVMKPNSRYMKAKLKALLQAVWDMGGIKVIDDAEVMASEKKVQQDAQDANQEMGTPKEEGIDPDMDDPEYQQDAVDEDPNFDYEDLGQNFSSTYDQAMFTRPLSQNILNRMAAKVTAKYESWRQRAASKLPPNELDLGQKTGRKIRDLVKSHDGAYGALVEQFGPWLKAQEHIIEKLGLDKKGEDAKRLEVYDTFYSMMGVAGNLLDEGQRVYINPISDALYETKAEMKHVGEYLYALVAPQANAAVARSRREMGLEPLVNDKNEDIGSGMSNAEAKERIKELEKGLPLQKFIMHPNNPIRTMFKMHQRALNIQLESEMLDKDSHDRMEAAAKIANKDYDKSVHTIPVPDFGDFRRLPLRGMLGMEDQYVRQEEEHDILGSGTASGRGFDMPHGKVYTKNAMGRAFLADPEMIFAHATQSYQDAVIRSTRAKSAQAINNLYIELQNRKLTDPNSPGGKLFDLFFDDSAPKIGYKQELDVTNTEQKTLYRVKQMEIPAEIADSGRALFVREKGMPKLIMFKDNEQGAMLASASKNLNYQQLQGFYKFLNIGTKYDSKLRTSWSPNFWVRNPLRDITNAWFNLDSEEQFKPMRNKVSNPKGFLKHASTIFAYEQSLEDHGKAPKGYETMDPAEVLQLAKTDIGAAYFLLKDKGGKTAFYKFNTLTELQEQGKKASEEPRKGGKVIKPLRAIKVFVDNLNTSIENVLRTRVIMHGLQMGMDLETELIPAARDVTVDFNKRGTFTQNLGAVVQFANPGIQGNRRFAKSLKKRGLQASLKLGGKVLSASITYNLLMRFLTARDEDDEDDMSTYYDDLSTHKRYTSIVMPHHLLGSDRRAPGYTEIPLGYGPHGAWALGDFIAKQMFTGGRDVVKDTLEFTKVMYQTYSPYAPLSVAEAAMPQPQLDLLRQIAVNEQWNGNTIYKEYTGSETASPSILSKKNTPKIYKDIADGLNEMAGGNKQVPGNLLSMFTLSDPLEISGSTDAFSLGGAWSGSGLEFFVEAAAGDVVSGLMEVGNWFSDDTATMGLPAPISGLVKLRGSSFRTYQEYQSLSTRAKQAQASLDSMDPAEKQSFLKSNKHYMKIIKAVEASEKAMKQYRRQRDNLEKQDQKNERVIQQLERLEVMRDNIQRRTIGLAREFGITV